MPDLTHTLLRLRARAGQLPPAHAAVANAIAPGPTRPAELLSILGAHHSGARSKFRRATAELEAAGVLVREATFIPHGRRTRCEPHEVLRLVIAPEARRRA